MTEGWDVLDELQFLFNKSKVTGIIGQKDSVIRFVQVCLANGIHWEMSDINSEHEYSMVLNNTILITDTRTNK